jgi:HK97 family phage major capsid protein
MQRRLNLNNLKGNTIMDMQEEVKASLGDLTKSVGDRIGVIEGDFAELRSMTHNLMAKMTSPNSDSGGFDHNQSTKQRKSLDLGIRALFAGDQSRAYQHFDQCKSMEAGVDPSGGYLVVPQFSTEMTKVMLDISPLSALARTIELTQGSSFEEVVDRNSADASWVGETSERGDTATPDIGKFIISLNELCAYPKLTQKLIDVSSIDVVTWLRDKVAESFAAKESDAFHNGNGVARPRGFLTYPTVAMGDATRTWGEIEHVKTGANGAFATASTSVNSADTLIDVVSAMRSQYRAGSRWLMSRSTAGVVRKIKDADGRHVWVDSLVEGAPAVLLGYPVDISEDMPVIATGSLSIAFSNWGRAYTIIRKLGVRFLVDPYSAPPYVKLHSYERVGGGVNNFEAIKLLKFSA